MHECELVVFKSGTWRYLIETDALQPSGVFQIPPRLCVHGEPLPLESIRMLSVVSKWVGPLANWDGFMDAFVAAGYNMVHFTPLQQRGMSNSPYSIFDHLELSADVCDAPSSLAAFVQAMQQKGLLGMIDMVWNHISCDSPHLTAHPEIGYNLENSPHLKVAYDLDEGILRFSREIGQYTAQAELHTEQDLQDLMEVFKHDFVPSLALWEYFVIDVGWHVAELERRVKGLVRGSGPAQQPRPSRPKMRLGEIADAVRDDGTFGRHASHVDMGRVCELYAAHIEGVLYAPSENERSLRLSNLLTTFRATLDAINYEKYRLYDEKLVVIIGNLVSRIRYERLDPNGPKMGAIGEGSPLVSTYFTRVTDRDGSQVALANNGWIWNTDPLVNFAEASSQAYFLREVVIWGDCVKLRYGQGPAENPWLWQYMTQYTQQMAATFQAFRIDNCHSTPIHVAEHLLNKGREVNAELYVCAELFTDSAERDMQFIASLGLNSLIREAMVSWGVDDLGQSMAKYGGQPLGSVVRAPEYMQAGAAAGFAAYSAPHAVYADCTHDNETPAQRRTPLDALPNAALVSMSVCGTGSVLGYDELMPSHINIVEDQRTFRLEDVQAAPLSAVKSLLHGLHHKMAAEGYTEIYVNASGSILSVIRENPRTRESYFLLSYHAFTADAEPKDSLLEFEGYDVECVLSAQLVLTGKQPEPSETHFKGMPGRVELAQMRLIDGMGWIEHSTVDHNTSSTRLHIRHFMPGSIIVLHRTPDEQQQMLMAELSRDKLAAGLAAAAKELSLVDLNMALYRCSREEHDSSRNAPCRHASNCV